MCQSVERRFVLKFIVGGSVLAASGDFLVTTIEFVLIGAQVFRFQLSVKQKLDYSRVEVLFDGRKRSLLGARLIFLLLEQLHDVSCKNRL